MFKSSKKSLLALTAFIFFGFLTSAKEARAAFTPLSIGVAPPLQLPPSDFAVTGARVSLLWGHHRSLYGVDLGLLGNITDLNFAGAAVSGVFNLTHGTTQVLGLQLAGITNINTNKTTVLGFQLAGLLNQNTAQSSVAGLQAALAANIAPFTTIYGVQAAIYNRAQEVYGLQIGLINVTENLHGVQIGLLNFNHKGLFTVAPFLNVGF